VNANETEFVVSIAPSLGEGLTNVIAGLFDIDALAEGPAVAKLASATALAVKNATARALERRRRSPRHAFPTISLTRFMALSFHSPTPLCSPDRLQVE
jgi:hypothetical protein